MGNIVKRKFVYMYLFFVASFTVTQAHAADLPAGFEGSEQSDEERETVNNLIFEIRDLVNNEKFNQAVEMYNSHRISNNEEWDILGVYVCGKATITMKPDERQKENMNASLENLAHYFRATEVEDSEDSDVGKEQSDEEAREEQIKEIETLFEQNRIQDASNKYRSYPAPKTVQEKKKLLDIGNRICKKFNAEIIKTKSQKAQKKAH